MKKLLNGCEIRKCEFKDFYNFRLFAFGNVIIEDNIFERLNTLQVGDPLGISLIGGGFQYFGRNKCVDVANQSLRLGLYEYGRTNHPDYNSFRVLVEYNEFCFTENFKYDRYSCYDAGIVYLYVNTCNSIVRYNYIHDIKGYTTHGIYCDDGAYGFSIYKNIVCNIMDGASIHSRTLTQEQMAEKINTDGHSPNVDNLIMYNIINAPYLFRGSTEYAQYSNETERQNNGCCCAMNLRMELLRGTFNLITDVSNINEYEDDVISKGSKSVGNVIKLGVDLVNWKMPSSFFGILKTFTK